MLILGLEGIQQLWWGGMLKSTQLSGSEALGLKSTPNGKSLTWASATIRYSTRTLYGRMWNREVNASFAYTMDAIGSRGLVELRGHVGGNYLQHTVYVTNKGLCFRPSWREKSTLRNERAYICYIIYISRAYAVSECAHRSSYISNARGWNIATTFVRGLPCHGERIITAFRSQTLTHF